jgi:hypothetical protein
MSEIPPDILAEAKAQAEDYARRGLLLTPREAWLLSGDTRKSQTLWSIAFNLAIQREISAEDLNAYLEETFPQYAKSEEPRRPLQEEEE